MNKNDDNPVSVSIPRKLYERLSERIGDDDPKTISKYITYVLTKDLLKKKDDAVFTENDKEIVKERLRRLGYF